MLELTGALEWMLFLTLIILVLSAGASVIRLIMGPTIWDRLLMVNLVSAKVVMFVTIYAVLTDSILILDVAIGYGIVGFLTITLLAKFIMTGGREK